MNAGEIEMSNAYTDAHSGPRRGSHRAHARPARARGIGSVIEIAVLVCLAALLILGIVASTSGSRPTVETTRVLAERGDTLWTLAKEHPIRGLTTEQVADTIADANGIQGGTVVAGSSLLVPAPASSAVALAWR
jgi:hypothetical protein